MHLTVLLTDRFHVGPHPPPEGPGALHWRVGVDIEPVSKHQLVVLAGSGAPGYALRCTKRVKQALLFSAI